MNTKLIVRRVGVLSLAKMMGALDALLGLIIGAFVSLFAVVGASLMQSAVGSAGLGMLFGVGAIIVFPILYGILGFITGLICGALYNVVAGIAGGIELEGVQTQG
jgi:hypothetical protein